LELQGVTRKVGAETHLYPTSVTLKSGAINVLLGATLAGKTTLMRVMAGLDRPSEGKVIAVGSGVRGEDGKLVALDVKKGDKVLFGKWSGTEVKIDGKELLIMKESDIMGVLEK